MKLQCRQYVAYTGVKLPFKFVNEITGDDLHLRNTYFNAYFDEHEKLKSCEKVVYGEIEFTHRYEYYSSGVLKTAEIVEDESDSIIVLNFDEMGKPVATTS